MKSNDSHPMDAIFRSTKRPDSKALEDRLVGSPSTRGSADEQAGGDVDVSDDVARPPVGSIDQGTRGQALGTLPSPFAPAEPKTLSEVVLRALDGRRAEEPLDFGP